MNIGMMNAISGLLAAQKAMDVTGHNLANASTPGYSRQRLDVTAADPSGRVGLATRQVGVGHVGTGVALVQIKRISDNFIHKQILNETSPLGEAKVGVDTLRQIEDILGDPSERSLATGMTRFFDAWQELTTHPESQPLRINLRETANNLCGTFNELYQKLTALRDDLNARIGSTVDNVNSLVTQIADLNREIKKGLSQGQNPNDLLDRRELLVEELSDQVKCNVVDAGNGAVNIYIDGQPLVFDERALPLQTFVPPVGSTTLPSGYVQVSTSPLTNPPVAARIEGGALKGLLDQRDVTLSETDPRGYIYQLNELANTLRADINALHDGGFDLYGNTALAGSFFYEPAPAPPPAPAFVPSAGNISINPTIRDLPDGMNYIAAAGQDPNSPLGGRGDNANALAIAQLRGQLTMNGAQYTYDDYYKGMVTQVGVQGQMASRNVTNQEALLLSVQDRRDAVSGVSTDEEMANVIRFQKAYAANARLLTTIDEMLERLMSIGVVGR